MEGRSEQGSDARKVMGEKVQVDDSLHTKLDEHEK